MDISSKLPPVHSKLEVKPDAYSRTAPNRSMGVANKDNVHISAQARQLNAAREALRQMPEVDLEKVAKIKARIKEGSYTVDPQKTASQMLQDTLLNDL